eukprot:GHVH01001626.1.p1 GENE.GHVH01001626.1~~GHVH01001626.1.p1  ORF type:complete len:275 (+),score=39.53 GHVH01001626.1:747-1571(+)
MISQELTLLARTPPCFTALWATSSSEEFIKRAQIDNWRADVKAYRTKSTQLMICHGESDQVSPFGSVVKMREFMNSHGYKTLSFTHGKGHEVPDEVQRVTVDNWLDRIDKLDRKGYPFPPKCLQGSCAIIPHSLDFPQKSDPLSTGVVHTTVAVTPPRAATSTTHQKPAKKAAPSDPQMHTMDYPGVESSITRLKVESVPRANQENNKNIESRYIHSVNLALEDPKAFRFSQATKLDLPESPTNDPVIFNMQQDSQAFGINSIWDPRGFMAEGT